MQWMKHGRSLKRFEDPVEVRVACKLRSEDQKLRDLVGMKTAERFFHRLEVGGGGFDEKQDFGSGFDGSLPAVNRSKSWDDVDARGKALIDEGAGDAFGFVAGAGGGENETRIGRGNYHRCVWLNNGFAYGRSQFARDIRSG